MKKNAKKGLDSALMGTKEVEEKIAVIRNKQVIADADVAALYGVQTKEVNQAVRNNANKFPDDYMFELSMSELQDLRSKITSTKVSVKSRKLTKVFTEKGGDDPALRRRFDGYCHAGSGDKRNGILPGNQFPYWQDKA